MMRLSPFIKSISIIRFLVFTFTRMVARLIRGIPVLTKGRKLFLRNED